VFDLSDRGIPEYEKNSIIRAILNKNVLMNTIVGRREREGEDGNERLISSSIVFNN
jgi:hypothetical protein